MSETAVNCGTWAWATLANKKGRENVAALNIDTRTIFAPPAIPACLTVAEAGDGISTRERHFWGIVGHGNQSSFPPPWSIEDIGAAFIVKDKERPKAWLFLLRGGARPAVGGEDAHER